ncbi:hypothetical protein DICPUDRAFT_153831 [Dictyostelium purpureum]|uniref:Major facilitator superfamily (MFS) profile domain-containing protein n=1 Tax=Dictyostelium purpureum TaxID=5786 RepID=F0ZPU9_DICPU|nr:uncharacterized protein DICPUDRAFT_153831 [Dictyostelium purpureum]EGC34040.1 hypothetical protein DICPUDRAFT_153831 [Dictyostelium purpureum]|eukprot:XP_003289444.1 hypothetical protein DICPUDRAFT_153831 [Dictyostelium purpureum]
MTNGSKKSKNAVDYSVMFPTPPYYFPRRFLLVILGFLGLAFAYLVRVLISTCITDMSEQYGWDSTFKGILLSSFFMGYVATQLLAQFFNERFGGKRTLLVGLTLSIASTLLIPVAAKSKGAVVAIRIFTGLTQGITFPTLNWLISRWFPSSQRSSSAASIWSGVYIGTIFIDFVAPIILDYLSWQATFYIFGGSGLIWSILWLIFIRDHPKDVPIGIHPNEVAFIAYNEEQGSTETSPLLTNNAEDDFFSPNGASFNQENRASAKEEPELPFPVVLKALLTSRGLLALLYYNLVTSWGFYLLLMWYPTYLFSLLGYNKGTLYAFYNAVPYMLSFVIGNGSGLLADKLLAKGVRKIFIRKGFGIVASIVPGIFLFLAAFLKDATPSAKIIFLTIVICCNGFNAGGTQMVTLDLSPRYAGITMGITNTVATIPGILGPLIAGILLEAFNGSWDQIFSMSAAFYISGGIVWVLLAKCDKVI